MAELNLGGLHEELGEMAEAEAQLPRRPAAATGLRPAPCPAGDAPARQASARRIWPPWSSGWPTSNWAPASAGAAVVCPGPRAGRPRRLCPRRRLPPPGQRPDVGTGPRPRANMCRPSTSGSSMGCVRVFDGRLLRARWPARVRHRRPVFVFGLPRSGTTLDRAGAGQPLADPRGRRVATGPAIVRGPARGVGPAGPAAGLPAAARSRPALPRLAQQHLDRLARPRRRPAASGSSTRCPTTTCIWASWRRCFRGPCSSTAAATCATWPCRAG